MQNTQNEIEYLEAQRKLLSLKQEVESYEDYKYRSRSVTVGTCFGGQVEIGLRTSSNHMFAILTPTETIEIIEQLAAGVGCSVSIKPKQDFAAWRGWEEVTGYQISGADMDLKGISPAHLPIDETIERKVRFLKDQKLGIVATITNNISAGRDPFFGYDEKSVRALFGNATWEEIIKMDDNEIEQVIVKEEERSKYIEQAKSEEES